MSIHHYVVDVFIRIIYVLSLHVDFIHHHDVVTPILVYPSDQEGVFHQMCTSVCVDAPVCHYLVPSCITFILLYAINILESCLEPEGETPAAGT